MAGAADDLMRQQAPIAIDRESELDRALRALAARLSGIAFVAIEPGGEPTVVVGSAGRAFAATGTAAAARTTAAAGARSGGLRTLASAVAATAPRPLALTTP